MSRWLVRYIQKHFDAVSFDIFDTLIERDVFEPADIFRLVGRDVLGAEEADLFYGRRQEAEWAARDKRSDREVTLVEIYEQLYPIYKERCLELKEAEIRREIVSCHAKKRMAALLEACVKSGMDVYLISDMYLPSEVIAQMVARCGIGGYRALYVSCEKRENKLNGALFRRVMSEYVITPGRMLHFGDSVRADFFGAHKAGVRAVLTRKKNRFRRKFRTG